MKRAEGWKMLKILENRNNLPFSALMEVYEESNRKTAQEEWPDLPEGFALQQAEQDFYHYLRDVFFKAQGGFYALWEVQGKVVSAVRAEPYRDGLLLEALETAPDHRCRGYAKTLLLAVLEQFPGRKIYSHVGKRNVPSLKTHEACGFCRILEFAVYIDGSVNDRSCTLSHE